MHATVEKFPSGRKVVRQYGAEDDLVSEVHSYGLLEIALTISFRNGEKSDELYFFRMKAVSRKRYEEVRISFPDMPAADLRLPDSHLELRKEVAEERKKRRLRIANRTKNLETAAKHDAFCLGLIANPCSEDASVWIKKPVATLGEMPRRASLAFVSNLLRKGALKVYACEICKEPGLENTGHVVVELPPESETRSSLLKVAGKWAERLGFEPYQDDGQSLVYIKLD